MVCVYFLTVLEISFERSNYSYMEPQGINPLVVDDIFMLKNIETELTYRISLQIHVVTGGATEDQDYDSALPSFLDFPPTQQRLQVFGQDTNLSMQILPDDFSEGEESIEISSGPVTLPPPAYSRPQTLASTTLSILDDDSKKNN